MSLRKTANVMTNQTTANAESTEQSLTQSVGSDYQQGDGYPKFYYRQELPFDPFEMKENTTESFQDLSLLNSLSERSDVDSTFLTVPEWDTQNNSEVTHDPYSNSSLQIPIKEVFPKSKSITETRPDVDMLVPLLPKSESKSDASEPHTDPSDKQDHSSNIIVLKRSIFSKTSCRRDKDCDIMTSSLREGVLASTMIPDLIVKSDSCIAGKQGKSSSPPKVADKLNKSENIRFSIPLTQPIAEPEYEQNENKGQRLIFHAPSGFKLLQSRAECKKCPVDGKCIIHRRQNDPLKPSMKCQFQRKRLPKFGPRDDILYKREEQGKMAFQNDSSKMSRKNRFRDDESKKPQKMMDHVHEQQKRSRKERLHGLNLGRQQYKMSYEQSLKSRGRFIDDNAKLDTALKASRKAKKQDKITLSSLSPGGLQRASSSRPLTCDKYAKTAPKELCNAFSNDKLCATLVHHGRRYGIKQMEKSNGKSCQTGRISPGRIHRSTETNKTQTSYEKPRHYFQWTHRSPTTSLMGSISKERSPNELGKSLWRENSQIPPQCTTLISFPKKQTPSFKSYGVIFSRSHGAQRFKPANNVEGETQWHRKIMPIVKTHHKECKDFTDKSRKLSNRRMKSLQSFLDEKEKSNHASREQLSRSKKREIEIAKRMKAKKKYLSILNAQRSLLRKSKDQSSLYSPSLGYLSDSKELPTELPSICSFIVGACPPLKDAAKEPKCNSRLRYSFSKMGTGLESKSKHSISGYSLKKYLTRVSRYRPLGSISPLMRKSHKTSNPETRVKQSSGKKELKDKSNVSPLHGSGLRTKAKHRSLSRDRYKGIRKTRSPDCGEKNHSLFKAEKVVLSFTDLIDNNKKDSERRDKKNDPSLYLLNLSSEFEDSSSKEACGHSLRAWSTSKRSKEKRKDVSPNKKNKKYGTNKVSKKNEKKCGTMKSFNSKYRRAKAPPCSRVIAFGQKGKESPDSKSSLYCQFEKLDEMYPNSCIRPQLTLGKETVRNNVMHILKEEEDQCENLGIHRESNLETSQQTICLDKWSHFSKLHSHHSVYSSSSYRNKTNSTMLSSPTYSIEPHVSPKRQRIQGLATETHDKKREDSFENTNCVKEHRSPLQHRKAENESSYHKLVLNDAPNSLQNGLQKKVIGKKEPNGLNKSQERTEAVKKRSSILVPISQTGESTWHCEDKISDHDKREKMSFIVGPRTNQDIVHRANETDIIAKPPSKRVYSETTKRKTFKRIPLRKEKVTKENNCCTINETASPSRKRITNNRQDKMNNSDNSLLKSYLSGGRKNESSTNNTALKKDDRAKRVNLSKLRGQKLPGKTRASLDTLRKETISSKNKTRPTLSTKDRWPKSKDASHKQLNCDAVSISMATTKDDQPNDKSNDAKGDSKFPTNGKCIGKTDKDMARKSSIDRTSLSNIARGFDHQNSNTGTDKYKTLQKPSVKKQTMRVKYGPEMLKTSSLESVTVTLFGGPNSKEKGEMLKPKSKSSRDCNMKRNAMQRTENSNEALPTKKAQSTHPWVKVNQSASDTRKQKDVHSLIHMSEEDVIEKIKSTEPSDERLNIVYNGEQELYIERTMQGSQIMDSNCCERVTSKHSISSIYLASDRCSAGENNNLESLSFLVKLPIILQNEVIEQEEMSTLRWFDTVSKIATDTDLIPNSTLSHFMKDAPKDATKGVPSMCAERPMSSSKCNHLQRKHQRKDGVDKETVIKESLGKTIEEGKKKLETNNSQDKNPEYKQHQNVKISPARFSQNRATANKKSLVVWESMGENGMSTITKDNEIKTLLCDDETVSPGTKRRKGAAPCIVSTTDLDTPARLTKVGKTLLDKKDNRKLFINSITPLTHAMIDHCSGELPSDSIESITFIVKDGVNSQSQGNETHILGFIDEEPHTLEVNDTFTTNSIASKGSKMSGSKKNWTNQKVPDQERKWRRILSKDRNSGQGTPKPRACLLQGDFKDTLPFNPGFIVAKRCQYSVEKSENGKLSPMNCSGYKMKQIETRMNQDWTQDLRRRALVRNYTTLRKTLPNCDSTLTKGIKQGNKSVSSNFSERDIKQARHPYNTSPIRSTKQSTSRISNTSPERSIKHASRPSSASPERSTKQYDSRISIASLTRSKNHIKHSSSSSPIRGVKQDDSRTANSSTKRTRKRTSHSNSSSPIRSVKQGDLRTSNSPTKRTIKPAWHSNSSPPIRSVKQGDLRTSNSPIKRTINPASHSNSSSPIRCVKQDDSRISNSPTKRTRKRASHSNRASPIRGVKQDDSRTSYSPTKRTINPASHSNSSSPIRCVKQDDSRTSNSPTKRTIKRASHSNRASPIRGVKQGDSRTSNSSTKRTIKRASHSNSSSPIKSIKQGDSRTADLSTKITIKGATHLNSSSPIRSTKQRNSPTSKTSTMRTIKQIAYSFNESPNRIMNQRDSGTSDASHGKSKNVFRSTSTSPRRSRKLSTAQTLTNGGSASPKINSKHPAARIFNAFPEKSTQQQPSSVSSASGVKKSNQGASRICNVSPKRITKQNTTKSSSASSVRHVKDDTLCVSKLSTRRSPKQDVVCSNSASPLTSIKQDPTHISDGYGTNTLNAVCSNCTSPMRSTKQDIKHIRNVSNIKEDFVNIARNPKQTIKRACNISPTKDQEQNAAIRSVSPMRKESQGSKRVRNALAARGAQQNSASPYTYKKHDVIRISNFSSEERTERDDGFSKTSTLNKRVKNNATQICNVVSPKKSTKQDVTPTTCKSPKREATRACIPPHTSNTSPRKLSKRYVAQTGCTMSPLSAQQDAISLCSPSMYTQRSDTLDISVPSARFSIQVVSDRKQATPGRTTRQTKQSDARAKRVSPLKNTKHGTLCPTRKQGDVDDERPLPEGRYRQVTSRGEIRIPEKTFNAKQDGDMVTFSCRDTATSNRKRPVPHPRSTCKNKHICRDTFVIEVHSDMNSQSPGKFCVEQNIKSNRKGRITCAEESSIEKAYDLNKKHNFDNGYLLDKNGFKIENNVCMSQKQGTSDDSRFTVIAKPKLDYVGASEPKNCQRVRDMGHKNSKNDTIGMTKNQVLSTHQGNGDREQIDGRSPGHNERKSKSRCDKLGTSDDDNKSESAILSVVFPASDREEKKQMGSVETEDESLTTMHLDTTALVGKSENSRTYAVAASQGADANAAKKSIKRDEFRKLSAYLIKSHDAHRPPNNSLRNFTSSNATQQYPQGSSNDLQDYPIRQCTQKSPCFFPEKADEGSLTSVKSQVNNGPKTHQVDTNTDGPKDTSSIHHGISLLKHEQPVTQIFPCRNSTQAFQHGNEEVALSQETAMRQDGNEDTWSKNNSREEERRCSRKVGSSEHGVSRAQNLNNIGFPEATSPKKHLCNIEILSNGERVPEKNIAFRKTEDPDMTRRKVNTVQRDAEGDRAVENIENSNTRRNETPNESLIKGKSTYIKSKNSERHILTKKYDWQPSHHNETNGSSANNRIFGLQMNGAHDSLKRAIEDKKESVQSQRQDKQHVDLMGSESDRKELSNSSINRRQVITQNVTRSHVQNQKIESEFRSKPGSKNNAVPQDGRKPVLSDIGSLNRDMELSSNTQYASNQNVQIDQSIPTDFVEPESPMKLIKRRRHYLARIASDCAYEGDVDTEENIKPVKTSGKFSKAYDAKSVGKYAGTENKMTGNMIDRKICKEPEPMVVEKSKEAGNANSGLHSISQRGGVSDSAVSPTKRFSNAQNNQKVGEEAETSLSSDKDLESLLVSEMKIAAHSTGRHRIKHFFGKKASKKRKRTQSQGPSLSRGYESQCLIQEEPDVKHQKSWSCIGQQNEDRQRQRHEMHSSPRKSNSSFNKKKQAFEKQISSSTNSGQEDSRSPINIGKSRPHWKRFTKNTLKLQSTHTEKMRPIESPSDTKFESFLKKREKMSFRRRDPIQLIKETHQSYSTEVIASDNNNKQDTLEEFLKLSERETFILYNGENDRDRQNTIAEVNSHKPFRRNGSQPAIQEKGKSKSGVSLTGYEDRPVRWCYSAYSTRCSSSGGAQISEEYKSLSEKISQLSKLISFDNDSNRSFTAIQTRIANMSSRNACEQTSLIDAKDSVLKLSTSLESESLKKKESCRAETSSKLNKLDTPRSRVSTKYMNISRANTPPKSDFKSVDNDSTASVPKQSFSKSDNNVRSMSLRKNELKKEGSPFPAPRKAKTSKSLSENANIHLTSPRAIFPKTLVEYENMMEKPLSRIIVRPEKALKTKGSVSEASSDIDLSWADSTLESNLTWLTEKFGNDNVNRNELVSGQEDEDITQCSTSGCPLDSCEHTTNSSDQNKDINSNMYSNYFAPVNGLSSFTKSYIGNDLNAFLILDRDLFETDKFSGAERKNQPFYEIRERKAENVFSLNCDNVRWGSGHSISSTFHPDTGVESFQSTNRDHAIGSSQGYEVSPAELRETSENLNEIYRDSNECSYSAQLENKATTPPVTAITGQVNNGSSYQPGPNLLSWSQIYEKNGPHAPFPRIKLAASYRHCHSEADETEIRRRYITERETTSVYTTNNNILIHGNERGNLPQEPEPSTSRDTREAESYTIRRTIRRQEEEATENDEGASCDSKSCDMDLDWYKPQAQPATSTSAHSMRALSYRSLEGSRLAPHDNLSNFPRRRPRPTPRLSKRKNLQSQ